MKKSLIYFDHNATTPIDERVLEAMLPFLKTFYGNPSALHRQGRLARSAIDNAREQIAQLVGAQARHIIFTSGGTEANNLAFSFSQPPNTLAISAIEHPSITEPAIYWQKQGCALSVLPVNEQGLITEQAIAHLLAKPPQLASIMLANNETGVIQPIEHITPVLKEKGVLIHTDAVQAVGKMPVNFQALGVDFLSLSGHKIYAPKGSGALVVSDDALIHPLLRGGGQERELRAGTENVPAIVGLGKAAELAYAELTQRMAHYQTLRHLLEQHLAQLKGVTIFAQAAPRLSNTVLFGIEGMDGEMVVMRLDQQNIAVSSGSACASGGNMPSPILTAMGIEASLAKSAIRVSFGIQNTEQDVLHLIAVLTRLIH